MPGHPFGQAAELCFLMDSRIIQKKDIFLDS
jgi:hypothetical protein